MIKVTYTTTYGQHQAQEYPSATRYELSDGVFHLYNGSRSSQVAAWPSENVLSIEVVPEVTGVQISGSQEFNGNYTHTINISKTGCGRSI